MKKWIVLLLSLFLVLPNVFADDYFEIKEYNLDISSIVENMDDLESMISVYLDAPDYYIFYNNVIEKRNISNNSVTKMELDGGYSYIGFVDAHIYPLEGYIRPPVYINGKIYTLYADKNYNVVLLEIDFDKKEIINEIAMTDLTNSQLIAFSNINTGKIIYGTSSGKYKLIDLNKEFESVEYEFDEEEDAIVKLLEDEETSLHTYTLNKTNSVTINFHYLYEDNFDYTNLYNYNIMDLYSNNGIVKSYSHMDILKGESSLPNGLLVTQTDFEDDTIYFVRSCLVTGLLPKGTPTPGPGVTTTTTTTTKTDRCEEDGLMNIITYKLKSPKTDVLGITENPKTGIKSLIPVGIILVAGLLISLYVSKHKNYLKNI